MSVVGPGTPYVTPEVLRSAPTGISWGTIPRRESTASAQRAEMLNMCRRATSLVDTTCGQVIRATINTEQQFGPDFRITVPTGSGNSRIMLSRGPVLKVLDGQICSATTFPRTWSDIDGDQFDVEYPVVGIYGTNTPSDAGDGGNAVILAPGLINWFFGRNGWALRIRYVNGWPHCGLTEDSVEGATTLEVDDTTGWAPNEIGGQGATGSIQDGEVQEAFTVTATSTETGPGIMTLAAPLVNAHASGVMATTLPDQLIQAAILYCCGQALTRGATATGVQSIAPGGTGGGGDAKTMSEAADRLCWPYKRVW